LSADASTTANSILAGVSAWSTATQAAISPECSCTSGHWSQKIRPHDAHSTPIALATTTTANDSYLEDGGAGIQMSAIPVDIASQRHHSAVGATCALLSPVNSLLLVRGQTTERRPQFSRLRTSRVEQSSSRTPSAEHFTASVRETTENVPVLG